MLTHVCFIWLFAKITSLGCLQFGHPTDRMRIVLQVADMEVEMCQLRMALQEAEQAAAPEVVQLRSLYCDPAVAHEFALLKEENRALQAEVRRQGETIQGLQSKPADPVCAQTVAVELRLLQCKAAGAPQVAPGWCVKFSALPRVLCALVQVSCAAAGSAPTGTSVRLCIAMHRCASQDSRAASVWCVACRRDGHWCSGCKLCRKKTCS
jgi:hypothetical protein